MAYEESVEQLKSLIEHFDNGGNDFNATDIEAIKYLLKENKQLKMINKEYERLNKEREDLETDISIQGILNKMQELESGVSDIED